MGSIRPSSDSGGLTAAWRHRSLCAPRAGIIGRAPPASLLSQRRARPDELCLRESGGFCFFRDTCYNWSR